MNYAHYLFCIPLFFSSLTFCMKDDKIKFKPAEEIDFKWEKQSDIPQEERNGGGWWLFSKEGWQEHIKEHEEEEVRRAEREKERARRDDEETKLMYEWARAARAERSAQRLREVIIEKHARQEAADWADAE